MAKLVFGMNVSLDGFVDHQRIGPPSPDLFQHYIDQTRALDGSIYGRGLYDVMRYWDDDDPSWDDTDRAFADAWRRQPKWVVSRTLKSVGPNAKLIEGDIPAEIGRLKADHEGRIDVGGPKLAAFLAPFGLIDEYQLHLRPAVLGHGAPYFAGPPPALRLVASERLGGDCVRVTCAPA